MSFLLQEDGFKLLQEDGSAILLNEAAPAVHERSASLAVTTAISTVGQRTLQRSAALSTTTAIQSSGIFWTTFQRSAALSVTATISTAAIRILPRSASLSVVTAISSSGQVESPFSTFERAVSLAVVTGIATVAVVVPQVPPPPIVRSVGGWMPGSEVVLFARGLLGDTSQPRLPPALRRRNPAWRAVYNAATDQLSQDDAVVGTLTATGAGEAVLGDFADVLLLGVDPDGREKRVRT